MADLATQLETSYSGAVFDLVGERGFEHCVLPKEIELLGLDRVMETLHFGEVAITPGDCLVGDFNGIVCIPSAIVADVREEVQRLIATGSLVRKAVPAGADLMEIYLNHGRF